MIRAHFNSFVAYTIFALILPYFVNSPAESAAQTPQAPVVLDRVPVVASPRKKYAVTEWIRIVMEAICFVRGKIRIVTVSSNDCDDTNRNVYPGIAIACAASCGQGTQTCQSNGSFTGCSCTPLCEAAGSGRCFYISALTGADLIPVLLPRRGKPIGISSITRAEVRSPVRG